MTMSAAPAQFVPVRFEFTHPTATTVCVAGLSTSGSPKPRLCIHGGRPLVEGDGFGPGTYEYCLVVDGQWMPDRWPEKPCPTRLAGETRF